MRTECCRRCGLEMEPDMKCNVCRDFIRLHCPKCDKSNDAQVHLHKIS